jgi:hypothetical protein
MDVESTARRLEAGEPLKIKYSYPTEGSTCAIRSDKLVDVSPELNRFYTKFRGKKAIWLEADEVMEITPDDGIYQDFA